jgi:hypothetical protein
VLKDHLAHQWKRKKKGSSNKEKSRNRYLEALTWLLRLTRGALNSVWGCGLGIRMWWKNTKVWVPSSIYEAVALDFNGNGHDVFKGYSWEIITAMHRIKKNFWSQVKKWQQVAPSFEEDYGATQSLSGSRIAQQLPLTHDPGKCQASHLSSLCLSSHLLENQKTNFAECHDNLKS